MNNWATITREERYFTSFLFHDLSQDANPLWAHIVSKLDIGEGISVVDIGYEVCLFRDASRAGIIEKQKSLVKQTFDLVLFLSDRSIVIIEAKAQQGFGIQQLNNLVQAKNLILGSSLFSAKAVYLVGIISDKYHPGDKVAKVLQLLIGWNTIAEMYPPHRDLYYRATNIYND